MALLSLRIDVEAARQRILDALGGAQNDPDDSPPFATEAKKVLERALREGLRSTTKEVAPEHILLGTLAEEDAAGVQILIDLGATPEAVRTALDEVA